LALAAINVPLQAFGEHQAMPKSFTTQTYPLLSAIALVAVLCLASPACAQEAAAGTPISDATQFELEKQFSQSVVAFYPAMSKYDAARETFNELPENERGDPPVDPAIAFVDHALKLEEQNRGTRLGISILAQLYSMAPIEPDGANARWRGRVEAIERLPEYADHELLIAFLRRLTNFHDDPKTEESLRTIIRKTSRPSNRRLAQCFLARWILDGISLRKYTEYRMAELKRGYKPTHPNEPEWIDRQWKSCMSADRVETLYDGALVMLKELDSETNTDSLPPLCFAKHAVYVIAQDQDKDVRRLSLREYVQSLIFKEEHLQRGRAADDFEIETLEGKTWKLSEQLGKIVVIQFSFVGCGPCERMYPKLAELQTRYADRIQILTVMADSKVEMTREKYAEGFMTWDVAFDGRRGPLGTRWAVRSYPQVFLINEHGIIEATESNEDRMIDDVQRLVQQMERGSP
ncbi:MAG: TlpA disulfide reductase family protein, partial [Planctomycetota bacterium]